MIDSTETFVDEDGGPNNKKGRPPGARELQINADT